MTYVHDGDGLLARGAEVLDHVLNEHGALSDLALCERVSWVRLEKRMGQNGEARIPVTISTLSLEMSLTGCSPSEDMV